jgi:hypothetical protein
MRMEDDVDAPAGIDLDGDVDMEWDGANEDEEYHKEEDEEDQYEDEEQDEDENDGREPRTIGQQEIPNPSADDVDCIVHDCPICQPEQGQQMCELTLWPSPPPLSLGPPPWEPRPPPPQGPETHCLSRPEHVVLLMLQHPESVVPTVQ